MEEFTYRDDLIRQAMAAHRPRMTSECLAEKAGLSRGTISAIINGSPAVRFSSLKAVADALKLPMQQLFEPKQETERAAA